MTNRLEHEACNTSKLCHLEAENMEVKDAFEQKFAEMKHLQTEYNILHEQLEEQRQRHNAEVADILKRFETSEYNNCHQCWHNLS